MITIGELKLIPRTLRNVIRLRRDQKERFASTMSEKEQQESGALESQFRLRESGFIYIRHRRSDGVVSVLRMKQTELAGQRDARAGL